MASNTFGSFQKKKPLFGSNTLMRGQQTAAQTASEGAKRLSDVSQATSGKSDPVSAIQEYARKQAEEDEKKKKEAAAKKKQVGVDTAPEDGFLTRMYKKYVSGEK